MRHNTGSHTTMRARRRIISLSALVLGAVSALMAFAFIASSASAQTPTATPTTSTELAPIDGLEVKLVGTNPVRFEAVVTSGLPSGCASFDNISMVRSGNRFDITVRNKMSVPAGGACTTIYGTTTNTVDLGTDYMAETTYTVVANAAGPRPMTKTFVAFIAGSTPPIGTPRFISTPVFGTGGQALAVFTGGSTADLEVQAKAAGATGVWAQGVSGDYHLLVVGGPAFVNDSFRAAFTAGLAVNTAVTLIR